MSEPARSRTLSPPSDEEPTGSASRAFAKAHGAELLA
jgi:hypothetical protein